MIYGLEPFGYWDDEPEEARDAREEREREEWLGQQMADAIDYGLDDPPEEAA